MNTQTLIQQLVNHTGKDLQFKLPDQSVIAGDLHITEIQNHSVDSVDCGGMQHQYQETVIQLWINENSEVQAEWTTDKALKIVDLVGTKLTYQEEAEIFIEFGDSKHATMRYSIKEIYQVDRLMQVELMVKPTVCKPRSLKSTEKEVCC